VVREHGTGGLEELVSHLGDSDILFAGLLATGVDQQENLTSVRPKFIFITWTGPKASALAKGRTSVQRPEVALLFSGQAIAIETNDKSTLTPKELGQRLLAAGGAHKPTRYEFGSSSQVHHCDKSPHS